MSDGAVIKQMEENLVLPNGYPQTFVENNRFWVHRMGGEASLDLILYHSEKGDGTEIYIHITL